jgi:TPR repeat protein
MYNLAVMLEEGDGRSRNIDQAIMWFERVASSGDGQLSKKGTDRLRALRASKE